MSKSIYDEALQELNDYKEGYSPKIVIIEQALEHAKKQEQEHIEYSKKVQEQFSNDTKRIGELESKLIKQEKLLELYKKLSIKERKRATSLKTKNVDKYNQLNKEIEIINEKIKELENE